RSATETPEAARAVCPTLWDQGPSRGLEFPGRQPRMGSDGSGQRARGAMWTCSILRFLRFESSNSFFKRDLGLFLLLLVLLPDIPVCATQAPPSAVPSQLPPGVSM